MTPWNSTKPPQCELQTHSPKYICILNTFHHRCNNCHKKGYGKDKGKFYTCKRTVYVQMVYTINTSSLNEIKKKVLLEH